MTDLQTTRKRDLAHDTFHQRGFTLTVLSHEGHFLPSFDGEAHVCEHRMFTVALPYLLADHRIITTAQTRRELQSHGTAVNLINLNRYDLLQLLDLLLYLHSFRGLVTETLNESLHLGNLLLLVLVGTYLLLPAFLPELHIFVVLHLIVDDLPAGDLQRTVRYIIYKGTVVTDQHNGFGRLYQELLQPLDTLNVKMVRGLVEQEHIRLLQQDLRQFDTHAPAAGELIRRTFQIGTGKTQSHQCTLYLRLVVLCSHHQVTLMLFRIALHQRHILVRLIVGADRQLVVHPVETLLQLYHPRKGLPRLFPHRGIILQDHHLRQITDGGIVRYRHNARCGTLLPTQNLQQRRFARPVLTHQGNTVTVVHDETGAGKERHHTEFHGQTFN